jgi:hypothetical protein
MISCGSDITELKSDPQDIPGTSLLRPSVQMIC